VKINKVKRTNIFINNILLERKHLEKEYNSFCREIVWDIREFEKK